MIYTNDLKSREYGREGPQNFCRIQETIAQGQGASENGNFEGYPTRSKTDSSSCFGIDHTSIPFSNEEMEAFYAYAFSFYQNSHWTDSVHMFRILCTKKPMEPRYWFGLAASLQEKGDFIESLHAWAMVALLKKEDPFPHFHAAECYVSLNELQEAKKALRETDERINETHPLKERIALLKEQWRLSV
jgi:type III secretion system low calcium response chaperone LcrH/SycD